MFTKTFTKKRAFSTSSLVVGASVVMTSRPWRRTQSAQSCSTQSSRRTQFTGTHSKVGVAPASRISNRRRVQLYAANGQPATAGATHARSTTESLTARYPTPKVTTRARTTWRLPPIVLDSTQSYHGAPSYSLQTRTIWRRSPRRRRAAPRARKVPTGTVGMSLLESSKNWERPLIDRSAARGL